MITKLNVEMFLMIPGNPFILRGQKVKLPFHLYLLVVYCQTQFFYPKEELYVGLDTYYTAEYFTECILSEIQKENKINILNDI